MMLAGALLAFSFPIVTGKSEAHSGLARGMMYCRLSTSGRALPAADNLAILLEAKFEDMPASATATYPVRAVSDPDNLLAGHSFEVIAFRPGGRIVFQTKLDSKRQGWMLVLEKGRAAPLYDAALGRVGLGAPPSVLGVCDAVQMINAEAEFAAHPAKRSTAQ